MTTVEKHFETIIITAFIAKQKIIIECNNGRKLSGFVHPDIDMDGFSLTDGYIFWKDIRTIQLTDQYFQFWEELLPHDSAAFDESE